MPTGRTRGLFRWPLLTALLALLLLTAACGESTTFEPSSPGELVVATNLPAPGFWSGDSAAAPDGGFEYRIAAELATQYGLQLRVIEVPFARIAAGDFGGADIAISQIALTAERERLMQFSTPYLEVQSGALTRKGVTLADLREARARQWVVEEGTTQAEYVRDTIQPARPALVVATREEALAALRSGRAEAALLDLPTALATARQLPEFDVPAQFLTRAEFAVALPRESGNLDAVNVIIDWLIESRRRDDFVVTDLQPALAAHASTIPVIAVPLR